MILADDLISEFNLMYNERWAYEWGKSEKGRVDCSGAFVYVYRLHRQAIPHGSNSIKRQSLRGSVMPISKAEPGMIAFKGRGPNDPGYDLPEKFEYSSDMTDYYHVGLVDGTGKYVLNAKSPKAGFSRDELTERNGWNYVGYLKDVDYGKGGKVMPEKEAIVVLPTGTSGSTVNMRSYARRDSAVITKVPVGSVVKVRSDGGDWMNISYGGETGWMMSNYLEYVGQQDETEGEKLTPEQIDQINTALKAIEQATEQIGSIVGRG